MTTKFNELSDLEILRLAEHERGKAVGAFFTKCDEQPAGFTGDVVAAE
jgi:hypothetical protein